MSSFWTTTDWVFHFYQVNEKNGEGLWLLWFKVWNGFDMKFIYKWWGLLPSKFKRVYPHPPFTISFSWFFLVWFYTRKKSFLSILLHTACRCSVTKCSDSSIAEALRTWKMHFWDPSQWDKMCFEYHRVIFHWTKWVKIFTFAYGQGQGGWP